MLSKADRGAQKASDSGVTLIELLVAMGLAVMLGTMATMFFVSAMQASNKTLITNDGSGDARVTLDSWTAMLRVAGWLDVNTQTDRFEEITPTKIVFYANLNNRSANTSAISPVTKVALILRQPTAGSNGQLVEVLFGSNNTTVQSVRELAFSANQADGAWVFTPYDRSGGPVDTALSRCHTANGLVPGLCVQAPAGAGMLDPKVSATGLSVTSGGLSGDGSADSVLADVGRVDISFAVPDPSGADSLVFASSASVNSGYPS